jgi:hypothetical protein
MPDADFTDEVTQTALRMISAGRDGDVDGEDVARELGRDPDDLDVYYALREAQRRGDLECDAWRGGMGNPGFVRLPPGR